MLLEILLQNFGICELLLPAGADGTTRVVTGPTSILPKTTGQQTQSLIKIQAPVTAAPTNQQRVQILKGPDGKLQVRGLMPGMINICNSRFTRSQ
jgi:nucleosome-remodeling factor subunit BPTF